MEPVPSTFALIGERYLDIQHDAEYLAALDAELRDRRVIGLKRVFYEYIAASALWWNIIWWAWTSLDERDIKIGWVFNLLVFGVLALGVGAYCGAYVALGVMVSLHLVSLGIGLLLRKGSQTR